MKDIENYLLEQIPLSKAMGVGVKVATAKQVVLSAPLANNINHKKTVFGGSLHAVATLSCWCLLHVNLKAQFEKVPQIVIVTSEIKYLAPVTQDFKAECHRPDVEEWNYFLKTLNRKGKARLPLEAKIVQDGQLCVDFSGIFAAI